MRISGAGLRSIDSLWLILGCMAAVTSASVSNSGDVDHGDMKVCIGTNSRLSVPSDKEQHYRNLVNRYTNCTYVDGNLELMWLLNENLNLSFLENIREVTGYILISHVNVKHVKFPKLQIIRGRTLFSLPVDVAKYALFVYYSKMFTLEMPDLRVVLNGEVGFHNNFNLCHIRSIQWNEILTNYVTYIYNFTAPERQCPKCHESCSNGCWGEGPINCQKLSQFTCSPQCAQGRCYGPRPRECCHLFCAGGCVGPTQMDCIACKNFYDDGVCKEECPPMRKYNPTSYKLEANPEGKYAFGATCVKECPSHLLGDNGVCVRSCPQDKMSEDGECVPCNGPCPKTCPGVSVLHSGNIESFRNCKVIDGNIRIMDHSFSGFQDVYPNYTLGARYIPLDPERLEVFSTVTEITGFLNIEGTHPRFKSLSYFRNLEIIHGRQQLESQFASFSIVKTSLYSLDLRNLKRISAGNVVIQHNRDLCYVNNIRWGAIQVLPGQKVFINENLRADLCERNGTVCSDQCNDYGCWGAGPDQCLNCKNFNYRGTCISDGRKISK
ncbi:hypothetical protein KR074_003563 [Drosophila pseudoananassae]|nr:hypothetical protein KR074_003563 [Drosophila pseudoananassae]